MQTTRFIFWLTLLAMVLLGFSASPYLRASPYTAQRLLSSTAIASGAYATSQGKYYGVRITTAANGTSGDATVWTGRDAFTDLGRGWINDALGARSGGWNDLFHATIWNGGGTASDLHPGAAYARSTINGMAPGVQVGSADLTGPVIRHAMLWHDTAASAVDLNPTGYDSSEARGAAGDVQVGSASKSFVEHAMAWNGSKSSYTDLQPRTGFLASRAYSVSRGREVGAGSIFDKYFTYTHALLWSGTADSVIDLNPPGYGTSVATKIIGDWVVGYGVVNQGKTHALMWDLSTPTPTVYDLHDDSAIGYDTSTAWNMSSSGTIVGVTKMYPANVPGGNFNAALAWTPNGPRLPGDANLDGEVSFADFQIWELNFGSKDSWWKTGDFNDDRVTDNADFVLLMRHYGESVNGTPAASVPEPSAVLWVAAIGLLARRGTRRSLS